MALVLTEVVGGAVLILGLFTRLAAVPLAFSMLVATVLVHLPNGFFSFAGSRTSSKPPEGPLKPQVGSQRPRDRPG